MLQLWAHSLPSWSFGVPIAGGWKGSPDSGEAKPWGLHQPLLAT